MRALTLGIVNPQKMVDDEVKKSLTGVPIDVAGVALVGVGADRLAVGLRPHALVGVGCASLLDVKLQ